MAGRRQEGRGVPGDQRHQRRPHRSCTSTDGGNACGTTSIRPRGGNGKLYYDHATRAARRARATRRQVRPEHRQARRHVGHVRESPCSSVSYAHWPAIALDGCGHDLDDLGHRPRSARARAAAATARATPAANEIQIGYTKDFGKTWSAPITVARPPSRSASCGRGSPPATPARSRSSGTRPTRSSTSPASRRRSRSTPRTIVNGTSDATRRVEVVERVRPADLGQLDLPVGHDVRRHRRGPAPRRLLHQRDRRARLRDHRLRRHDATAGRDLTRRRARPRCRSSSVSSQARD